MLYVLDVLRGLIIETMTVSIGLGTFSMRETSMELQGSFSDMLTISFTALRSMPASWIAARHPSEVRASIVDEQLVIPCEVYADVVDEQLVIPEVHEIVPIL